MKKIKISIITATFNSVAVIEKSILSVISQSFTNFEYIIIDGGSTDGTRQIIEKYKSHITYTISEKDKGIYDAWNKGLEKATGDWVMFIGADDFLVPDALQSYASFINETDTKSVLYISSKVNLLSQSGEVTRTYGWPWKWDSFKRVNLIAHPGSLQSMKLFKDYGQYDISYKIVGDYELLLRPKEKLNALFLNKVTVDVTEGGASSKIETFYELRRAVLNSKSINKALAFADFYVQVIKFVARKFGKRFGLTLYLRKEY